jgi:hypothetical protein
LNQFFETHPRSRRTVLQNTAALFAVSFAQSALAQVQSLPVTHSAYDQGITLVQVLYLLAPNIRFTRAQYQKQADIMLLRMTKDSGLRERLLQGIEKLNAVGDKAFMRLTEEGQRDALRTQVGTPFWAVISNPAVGIYNNPDIWPLIGYEGPAFEKGGYLFRGVNDIAWLPK